MPRARARVRKKEREIQENNESRMALIVELSLVPSDYYPGTEGTHVCSEPPSTCYSSRAANIPDFHEVQGSSTSCFHLT